MITIALKTASVTLAVFFAFDVVDGKRLRKYYNNNGVRTPTLL